MAGDGGTAAVPDLATLPEPVRAVVADVYGQAAAELFLVGAPITALAVLFIKEKPLRTLSGKERRAQEEAATGIQLL